MNGFSLVTSHRMERLAHTLARRTHDRPADPLIPETIVVQSRGMERWLSLEIARHAGICANIQFPFPESFLRTVLQAAVPGLPEEPHYQRDVMMMAIFGLLPRYLGSDPAFRPLRSYLRDDARGAKRLQLSEHIALLFDQYLVFRPDMIVAWDEGRSVGDSRHHRWQAVLWRELTHLLSGPHPARLWRQMLTALHQNADLSEPLPDRVSVFGISYLPPVYLQAFWALATVMRVDFYHLNPCREYWADIVSQGEEKRIRRVLQAPRRRGAPDDFHLEVGNRLLASMGNQGRAFQHLLGELDPLAAEDFEDDFGNSLLEAVQADILHLRHGDGDKKPCQADREPDLSLQIHACHSPMREIEVLYDQLLDLLNGDPLLQPRDILVLTPDIDTYAPYIQAVFGAPEDGAHRLAFSIADRKPVQGSPLVLAFSQLLEMNQSRFQASELLALLEAGALRTAFDLTEEDLQHIGQWVSDTRIRWGLDAASKSPWGLPATEENTWQAGLDRLLLGYAVPSEHKVLFQHILPAGGAEGSNAETLGHLMRFMETLQRWQRTAGQTRPLSEWALYLLQLLDDFFEPGPTDERDLQLLRRLATDMRHYSQSAQADEAVGIEVVRGYLKRRLDEERAVGGFISGGITFGALLPMRSIPAKVICLLGMNYDLFPREDRPLGFDLMAANPRIGDRSRREDDKYLFLEALMSARQTFYLSYVGFDIQDNAPLPPSVLVSELIDYIDEAYCIGEGALITFHRLQAFSSAYFIGRDQRYFSYSRQACDAARSLARARARRDFDRAFLTSPLREWEARFQTVAIAALVQALCHPSRFLLENRLQLRLSDEPITDRDRESFVLDPLERYTLGQDILQELLSPDAPSYPLDVARAEGRLPHGDPGRVSFDEIRVIAEDIAAAVRSFQGGAEPAALMVQDRIGAFTVTGVLEPIFPAGQLCCRFGAMRGVDLIGAWVRHLLWCRRPNDTDPGVTLLITRDERRRFRHIAEAEAHLQGLLAVYRRAGHGPVPLFPRASWDYAVLRLIKGYAPEKAMDRVRSHWQTSHVLPGEAEDPYVHYCFHDALPLDEAFAEMAEALYGPILENSEKL
jgi:exodeoxyribonuclease V gamma subunit